MSKPNAGISVSNNADGSVKYTAWSNSGQEGDKGYRVSITRDSGGNVTNVHSTDQSVPKGGAGRH